MSCANGGDGISCGVGGGGKNLHFTERIIKTFPMKFPRKRTFRQIEQSNMQIVGGL